jgi:hypothetical protein
VDLGQWFRAGVRPERGVARLGRRIKTVSVPMQLSQRESQAFDEFLATLVSGNIQPIFIGFQAVTSIVDDTAGVTNSFRLLDAAALGQRH